MREDVASSLCSSNERMGDTLHALERRLDHNNRHHDDVLGLNLRAWLGPPDTVEPVTRGPDARYFPAVFLHAVRDAQHVAIWPRCARLPQGVEQG